MRLLVTGSSGFVGSALCAAARSAGLKVVEMRRAGSSDEIERQDSSSVLMVEDIEKWAADAWKNSVSLDAVVHLAAIAHPRASSSEMHRVNVEGALNVAREAKKLGARRFVFVSSAKAFGDRSLPGAPFRPSSVCEPRDAYGRSKRDAEVALTKLAADLGLELVIVRAPMVYGGKATGNFALMAKALRAGLPLPLGMATEPRSYVAVDNLCDFLLRCVSDPRARGQVLHVADDNDVSSANLAREIGQAMGSRACLVPIPGGLVRAGARAVRKSHFAQSLFGRLQVETTSTKDLLEWRPGLSRPEALRKYLCVAPSLVQDRRLLVLDKAVALVGLVGSAPLCLTIAIAGLVDTGSPFFVQERVGQGEDSFRLIKFRTMRMDTVSTPTHLALSSSVTRLGRLLRATKLDELPQLVNVLRGEMSLVGPRPCLPSQTELRSARRDLGVDAALPGITGLGQIQGVDMSSPALLASLDAQMLSGLNTRTYLRYLLVTVLGGGRGDNVQLTGSVEGASVAGSGSIEEVCG